MTLSQLSLAQLSLANTRAAGGGAPTLQLSSTSVAEDASLSTVVGALSVANLPDGVTVSGYSITADPDSKFDISSSNLITDAALDYETATSHSVTIRATLSEGDPVDRTFSISVTDVDDTAPTITSNNTASVNENATLAHALTANEAVTWSIIGGADQAEFEIFGSTLRWASNGTQDYESPADADMGNDYVVQVRATDASGNFADQTITVSVQDVDEAAPTVSSYSPTDGATDIAVEADLVVTFNENVQFGTGNIDVYNADGDVLIETFDVEADVGAGAGQVSISGAAVTIKMTSDFGEGVDVYVQIDSTAIEDLAGNAFAGIADTTTWNFTTEVSDTYAVSGNSPDLVADWAQEYYRISGSVSDLDTMMSSTSRGSGMATMVDSSGNLVWSPHNLLTYSEQIDNAAWTKIAGTVTANNTNGPDGNATADKLTHGSQVNIYEGKSLGASYPLEFSAYYKQSGAVTEANLYIYRNSIGFVTDATFSFSTVSAVDNTGSGATITASVSDWYYCTINGVTPASAQYNFGLYDCTEVFVWGAHAYRSDLGGMADVPSDLRSFSTATKYVSTTSAARYLYRFNHYVWNGASFENRGVLIETDGATNLVTYSKLDANWTNSALTKSINVSGVTAPDGTETAVGLIANSSPTTHYTQRTGEVALTGGSPYTLYAFVKTADKSVIMAGLYNNASNYIDLTMNVDGTIINAGSAGFTVGDGDAIQYNSEWSIVWVELTPTNSVTFNIYIGPAEADNDRVFAGDGSTIDIYVWNIQVAAGSLPSSIIPTNGSTVARAADNALTIPAANLPYNSSNMWGSIHGYETYADEAAADQVTLMDWRADANNYITITLSTDTTNVGLVTLKMAVAGTEWTVSSATELTPGVNASFDIAWRVTASEINVAVNGDAGTANTSPTSIPNLASADMTFEGNGTRSLVKVADDAINDTVLEAAAA